MCAKRTAKVTIVDVAREAGVSHATVSRVLNNTGYIKESTRQQVMEAVDRLGYVANQSARSLAGAPAKLVGLLLPGFLGNYIGTLAEQVDSELYKAGYDTAIFPHHNLATREKALIERTTTGLLDGLIIMVMSMPRTYIELLEKRDIDYVLIGSEGSGAGQPVVSPTNFQGAYDATSHLLDLGHRRIGFLRGPDGRASSLDRLAGYRAALLDREIDFDEALIGAGSYDRDISHSAAMGLLNLEEPPTAIFAGNDASAIGVMDAARERGLRIPADLSVVGFDDTAEARVVTPQLTTVHAPIPLMAREAVRMLLERMNNPDARIRSVSLATHLVIRESTARPGV